MMNSNKPTKEQTINDTDLQDMQDTANGEALLNDDELLVWLKKDVIRLISEVRRMRESMRMRECAGCKEGITQWPHLEKVWRPSGVREYWHTKCFAHAHPLLFV